MKENTIVLEPAALEHISIFELKNEYILLGKEFKQKSQTVQALQRNFTVLSKLCAAEQEEKQKYLDTSIRVRKEFDEKNDKCVELYEEVEKLKDAND